MKVKFVLTVTALLSSLMVHPQSLVESRFQWFAALAQGSNTTNVGSRVNSQPRGSLVCMILVKNTRRTRSVAHVWDDAYLEIVGDFVLRGDSSYYDTLITQRLAPVKSKQKSFTSDHILASGMWKRKIPIHRDTTTAVARLHKLIRILPFDISIVDSCGPISLEMRPLAEFIFGVEEPNYDDYCSWLAAAIEDYVQKNMPTAIAITVRRRGINCDELLKYRFPCGTNYSQLVNVFKRPLSPLLTTESETYRLNTINDDANRCCVPHETYAVKSASTLLIRIVSQHFRRLTAN